MCLELNSSLSPGLTDPSDLTSAYHCSMYLLLNISWYNAVCDSLSGASSNLFTKLHILPTISSANIRSILRGGGGDE